MQMLQQLVEFSIHIAICEELKVLRISEVTIRAIPKAATIL